MIPKNGLEILQPTSSCQAPYILGRNWPWQVILHCFSTYIGAVRWQTEKRQQNTFYWKNNCPLPSVWRQTIPSRLSHSLEHYVVINYFPSSVRMSSKHGRPTDRSSLPGTYPNPNSWPWWLLLRCHQVWAINIYCCVMYGKAKNTHREHTPEKGNWYRKPLCQAWDTQHTHCPFPCFCPFLGERNHVVAQLTAGGVVRVVAR